jgi:hypothetical protein
VSYLQMELKAALVDLGHKSAFDLLLKEAWNPEQAAMGNSTLPTVCDKLNIMASIHQASMHYIVHIYYIIKPIDFNVIVTNLTD